MANKLNTIVVIALLVACLPVVASAETVVRTGESVSVESNQIIENDFYAAGGTITMSGDVTGDMYAAGGTVTVNGQIGQDLTLFAGSAQVHASTTDDVRVLGGETVIAEFVGGDVFVIGGLLKILSTAEIAGDVIFYGGELEISGPVAGSVAGVAEAVRIDASVGGDVEFTSSREIVLGDRASIAGNVRYTSMNEITRAQNAVVEGEIVKATVPPITESVTLEDILIPIFILLFATLSLYLVFRRELQLLMNQILEAPAKSGLLGVALLLGGPMASILLMITVLGLLVGLMSLFAWLFLVIAAFALTGVLAGVFLAKLFTQKQEVNLLWILGGTIGVFVLSFVPVIGGFGVFVLFVLVLGGLCLSLYRLLV